MKVFLLSVAFVISYFSVSGQMQPTKAEIKSLVQEVHGITSELSRINGDSIPHRVNTSLSATNAKLESIATTLDSINRVSQRPEPSWHGYRMTMFDEMAGAFLGALGTLLVFYLTMRSDKRKERRKDKNEAAQNNSYLQSLIIATLGNASAQRDFLKSHIDAVRANPGRYNERQFSTIQDLKRLVKTLEQDKYYHAYLGEFKNTKESIDNFRAITASADYLYEVMDQLKGETVRNAILFDHNRRKEYQKMLEDGNLQANEIAKQAETQMPELAKVIYAHITREFTPTHPTDDITVIQNQFVEPFKKELLSKYTNVQPARLILENLKQMTTLYSDIIAQNKHHADVIEYDYKSIVEALGWLEKGSKDLIEKHSIK